MGLIREPKNVDFYILDKPWTDQERKEFSTFIRLCKEQQKKETHEKLFQQNERKLLLNSSTFRSNVSGTELCLEKFFLTCSPSPPPY